MPYLADNIQNNIHMFNAPGMGYPVVKSKVKHHRNNENKVNPTDMLYGVMDGLPNIGPYNSGNTNLRSSSMSDCMESEAWESDP